VDNPRAAQEAIAEYERLSPVYRVDHAGRRILFSTPTGPTRWRAERLFVNEPATLDWIAGLASGEVLLDVGANVGMYAIWAAATRGVRVFALEPESQHYATLNRNIQLNGLSELVTAYCLAASNVRKRSLLHVKSFAAGQALHAFDEPYSTEDSTIKILAPFDPAHRQGCLSATIDDLVADGMPAPDHVKIDVDGFENLVVAGAQRTIASRTVRSLLIETNLNLAGHRAFVDWLAAVGYRLTYEADGNMRFERMAPGAGAP
jgi:FkbM family methyltransferase